MIDALLLSIAKAAILSLFDNKTGFNEEDLVRRFPYLANEGACFVTLHKHKELRGCIGSVIAHRTLLEDLYYNAQAAAFSDPRFKPLHESELSSLELEVSLLSTPRILRYDNFEDLQNKIRPHIDGVILRYGAHQGTFLPQVWDQILNPKDFLEHLSYKAGTNPSIFAYHPEIYIYQVEALSEQFDAILPL